MPLYEYRCPDCGVKYEKIVPSFSSPVPECPNCAGSNAEKLISVPGGVGVGVGSASASGAPCAAGKPGGCGSAGFG